MSLIETALKKLQSEGHSAIASPEQAPLPPLGRRAAQAPAAPAERKRRMVIQGPKHKVPQVHLVQRGLLPPVDQAAAVAEEFRRIKRPLIANTFAEPRDERSNVIMITSALPGAGKTFCSLNLALSMSLERDFDVLLVDADVAKPHITQELGLADAPGLIDLLLEEDRDIASVLVRTDMNDLHVLPAGRKHPQATELLASERMSRIVHELATSYSERIILLDSPPMLVTSEAQALASQAGQITLIVESGKTSHQELAQTLEALEPSKAVSIVLNKSVASGRFRAEGYYGEYGEYRQASG